MSGEALYERYKDALSAATSPRCAAALDEALAAYAEAAGDRARAVHPADQRRDRAAAPHAAGRRSPPLRRRTPARRPRRGRPARPRAGPGALDRRGRCGRCVRRAGRVARRVRQARRCGRRRPARPGAGGGAGPAPHPGAPHRAAPGHGPGRARAGRPRAGAARAGGARGLAGRPGLVDARCRGTGHRGGTGGRAGRAGAGARPDDDRSPSDPPPAYRRALDRDLPLGVEAATLAIRAEAAMDAGIAEPGPGEPPGSRRGISARRPDRRCARRLLPGPVHRSRTTLACTWRWSSCTTSGAGPRPRPTS